MRRVLWLLFFVVAASACGWGIQKASAAEAQSFRRGETLNHMLSVCLSLQSAVSILQTDATRGFEEALKAWAEKEDCGVVTVSGATVGRVASSVKVNRPDGEKTASAVEIVANGSVIGYFLSTKPILAHVERES